MHSFGDTFKEIGAQYRALKVKVRVKFDQSKSKCYEI